MFVSPQYVHLRADENIIVTGNWISFTYEEEMSCVNDSSFLVRVTPSNLTSQFCWFLTPWLVYYIPLIVILFVSPVLTIYAGEYVDLVDYEAQRWTILLALFPIGLGLVSVYFWIVVYNHFDFLGRSDADDEYILGDF